MARATLTTKGQVTIPKAVRTAANLRTGDRVEFRVRPDGVIELVPETGDLRRLFGVVKPRIRGVTLADMDRAIAAGAARR